MGPDVTTYAGPSTDLDVAVASSGSNQAIILANDGAGAFTQAAALATEAGPFRLAAGDLNNDALVDLVVTNLDAGTVSIFLAEP